MAQSFKFLNLLDLCILALGTILSRAWLSDLRRVGMCAGPRILMPAASSIEDAHDVAPARVAKAPSVANFARRQFRPGDAVIALPRVVP